MYQAEVELHQAFAQVKFREYVSALLNIRRAYKLLEENENNYPFTPDDKSMGMLKAMLGIIPAKYQWGLSLLGMEGNLSKGMDQLKLSASTNFFFRREAVAIYAMLLLHLESKPQEAWKVIKNNKLPYNGDLFSYFVAANIAVYGKHNAEAITILSTRPSGNGYEPFPYLDYLTGLAYLQQLDLRQINIFNRFFLKQRMVIFIKSAYHKLAWSALVNRRPQDYATYIQKVKTSGVARVVRDKQAQKEALSGIVPDTTLLKARFIDQEAAVTTTEQ